MLSIKQVFLFISLLVVTTWVQARPVIFACEPEWGALVHELMRDSAEIYVATNAAQDPHHVEARPSLLAATRRADMVVCTGAELETGWLPILLRESANDKIQAGATGYFMASDYVTRLDIPERVDRSEGDVHAAGNPHIQTDPRNIAMVAVALARSLQSAFPDLKENIAANAADFAERWQQAMQRWVQQAEVLHGQPVLVQHSNWRYLTAWLQLKTVAALEPKPGIPPNAGYLAQLLALQQKTPARLIMVAAYEDTKAARWMAVKTGLPVVTLPFTVGAKDAEDLFTLFDITLQRLTLAATNQAARSDDGY